ncbi:YIP1 family protein [Halobacteria archaeon HArc-gm2]|nr:YIP1 family protein [Halobacteria archaeon HArc-gm2]
MTTRFRTLFVRPADAFAEVPDRPSLLAPALVVFALGVVVAVQSVPLMAVALGDTSAHSLQFATGDGALSVQSAAPLNLAVNVGVAFAPWLVLATITHVGARLAGGTGTPRQTLAAVAWCAVPWLFVYGASVVIAAGIAATTDATLAAALGGHSLSFVEGRPPAYFDGSGVLDGRTWLFVVGLVLSARIWARAVTSAHGPRLARGANGVAAAVVALAVLAVLL